MYEALIHIFIRTLIQPIVLRCSIPLLDLLQPPSSVYRIWNNGWIWTFKMSKRPYQSLLHDRTICKWRQCLLDGQKWNWKIIPLLSIKSSPVNRFQSLRCLNDHINLPYTMGSLASGVTKSLVAKIGTKDLATSCSVDRF